MKVSIVIPSYGSYHLLDECLRRIYRNTDLNENGHEIIVVCNGCDKQSAELVIENGLRLVWIPEAIGFTLATNIGFRMVRNPITLIMNTDAHILDYWAKNDWLNALTEPFQDPTVGLTGPNVMVTEWTEFLPFYCTAIRSELFERIGYLDEAFSPGYGEDIDFCLRARLSGYQLVAIDPHAVSDDENQWNISSYPLWHRGAQSFTDAVKRNEYIEKQYTIMVNKWGKR